MKVSLLSLSLLAFSLTTFAQKPLATSCTKGNCYKFSVKIEERGTKDRLYFVITNKDPGEKDLELFILDKEDGKWWSQGSTDKPLPFNGTTTFNRFPATDNYIIFYRNAGDNTVRFPSQAEVREKFGKKKYGYGNY